MACADAQEMVVRNAQRRQAAMQAHFSGHTKAVGVGVIKNNTRETAMARQTQLPACVHNIAAMSAVFALRLPDTRRTTAPVTHQYCGLHKWITLKDGREMGPHVED